MVCSKAKKNTTAICIQFLEYVEVKEVKEDCFAIAIDCGHMRVTTTTSLLIVIISGNYYYISLNSNYFG